MPNEEDIFDFEALDKEIDEQLGDQLKQLETLKTDAAEIGSPKKLTESISQIVWEQFVGQIAGQAGLDFIKENNNLNLSLKKADHILNEDSFMAGDLPKHNFDHMGEYQQRREDYLNNFKKDEDGNVVFHDTRMGTKEQTLAKGARDPFDNGRPTGSKTNHTSMDHTVSAGEILRDKKAGAFLNQDEKLAFANSDVNLNEIDEGWNSSKGDLKMDDWLDTPNANGQKPREIFDMSEEDEAELRAKDAQARKEWENRKAEGEQRAIEEGNESRKQEALRSTKYTAQAVLLALLAKLTRTIFQELIRWLGEKDRKASTFLNHMKKAVKDFFMDVKGNLLLSADVAVTVILTQIFGEIIPMIRKALLFVQVGGQCAIEVHRYLKDPVNAQKDTSIKVMEIGKIVTVGVTTASGIALGMAITAILEYYVPALAVQIPLLGSPASLIGIFFGGLTAGICGAIVLHQIDKSMSEKMSYENMLKQLDVQMAMLDMQETRFAVTSEHLDKTSSESLKNIKDNHEKARDEMGKLRESLDNETESENKEGLDNLDSLINSL